MKIKQDHYETLKAAIIKLDTPARRQRYLTGQFPRAEAVKDLDKRYRWDLLYASLVPLGEMYAYLNDDRIYTALKAIVPPLESKP